MGNSDGGFKVPKQIADQLTQGTSMYGQQFQAAARAQQAFQLQQQMEQAVSQKLRPNVLVQAMGKDTEDALKQALLDVQKKTEIEASLRDVQWFREMRDIISRRLGNEEISAEELEKLCRLLSALQFVRDVSEYNKRRYAVLHRRLEKKESLIFIDYEVLSDLRDELNDLQVGRCKMKITKVECSKDRIKARIEIDPALPANYVTISVTVEPTMLDAIHNNQIIPHEVASEMLDKKVDEVLKDVEKALGKDLQADRMKYLQPFGYDASFATSDYWNTPMEEEKRPIEQEKIDFRARMGKAIIDLKSAVKATTS